MAAQSPGASILPLSPASDGSGAATVSVVYQADGTGFLIGDALPELETDRTYQLWAIVDGRVISAGVLGNRPGVSPFQFVGDLDGLVVTEEAMGGVVSEALAAFPVDSDEPPPGFACAQRWDADLLDALVPTASS